MKMSLIVFDNFEIISLWNVVAGSLSIENIIIMIIVSS